MANRSVRLSSVSTERLFGRHVARRPHHGAGTREVVRAGDQLVRGRTRQTEVEQLHAVWRQKHVRRFEIAMNHAAGMQRRQRVEDPQPGRDRLGDAQWRGLEPLGQRRALEQFHGDEQHTAVLADLVDLTDVRMIDRRGRTRLAPEALARSLVVGERRHRLQCDRALELLVARGVDDTHPALAELALDPVVAEPGRHVAVRPADRRRGHTWSASRRTAYVRRPRPAAFRP